MENNDLNDILRDLGIDAIGTPALDQQQETTENPPAENSSNTIPFSEEDITAIIADNELSEEDNEAPQSSEVPPVDFIEENESNEEESQQEEEETPQEETNNLSKIPLNSPTLLVDESTSRFSGAEWFQEIQKARVIVAGIGGIGSNFCFQLARMVPESITMYDMDIVEKVNMAGQLFSTSDIGSAKVDAMSNMILSYTSMLNVMAISEAFGPNTETGDIMVCGFDNMRARKLFFSAWVKHVNAKSSEEKANCLYIDGRLSMTDLQIFCIRGDDTYNINRYFEEFLFSDAVAEVTVCSMKQTTYLACMIGSLMTNLFTNFIANKLNPIIPYDLPFFTEYNAQSMIFKTEN